MAREDYYETFDREGLLEDDYVPWSQVASASGQTLRVTVPMPEGVELDEILELRAGREWKIDGFQASESAHPPKP